jgi:chromosome partitioning protein
VLAATKGGVGKTTLSACLACWAAKQGHRVGLIDADPQASLSRWAQVRGNNGLDQPELLNVECAPEALGHVAAEGYDWLFVDTPPALVDDIQNAVEIADFVLVPSKTSIDVEAMDQIVEIIGEESKPFAFVLNDVEARWKLDAGAATYLAEAGRVLKETVGHRRAYVTAMLAGKTGPEAERDGKCAEEIAALWKVVQRAVASARAKA